MADKQCCKPDAYLNALLYVR